jgi:putative redox protein
VTTITATLTHGTAVTLSNGRHEWHGDEPVGAGGSDTGPNPYELLLGALAACTCITLSLYAAHKGITLHKVSARFSHDRTYEQDCDDAAEDRPRSGHLDRITSEIEIESDADEGQKQRLAQVAVRCPVHRTLENQVVFCETVRV